MHGRPMYVKYNNANVMCCKSPGKSYNGRIVTPANVKMFTSSLVVCQFYFDFANDAPLEIVLDITL